MGPTLCKQDGGISSLSKPCVVIAEITLGYGKEIKASKVGLAPLLVLVVDC